MHILEHWFDFGRANCVHTWAAFTEIKSEIIHTSILFRYGQICINNARIFEYKTYVRNSKWSRTVIRRFINTSSSVLIFRYSFVSTVSYCTKFVCGTLRKEWERLIRIVSFSRDVRPSWIDILAQTAISVLI